MKILHLADTHLGYSAYRKTTEDGVNQREIDIYNAFSQCIDYAVKTKPDLVLHAGDLFDSVRPTNRAITVAIQQILRLSKEHIPFIVISGNHETPKLRETGNIFMIFEHLDQVYPIYKNQYEAIQCETSKGTITVHGIPQCQTPNDFTEQLKRMTMDKKAEYNVLLAHGAVAGIKEFTMNECNELFIPIKNLQNHFDYIALGHYHTYTKLQENTFYAGSTEHLSFTEANDQKGLLEIEMKNKITSHFIPVKTRAMIDVPPFDCSTLSCEQILKKIKETIISIEPNNKIIRIRLQNVPSHIQRGLDVRQIKELCKHAVHCEIKTTVIQHDHTLQKEGTTMVSLADEFEKFLKSQQITQKEILLKLGLQYINKIEKQDETS